MRGRTRVAGTCGAGSRAPAASPAVPAGACGLMAFPREGEENFSRLWGF